ncbi:hypothetical protein [Nocardioides yefusunii]|uniref:Uncharacterized protein n=1 Tax=Nocardioides yefusunii TaxID=2500546 RepID=A0ABW1QZ73_9ACTN|nr:hypothetical protein [Nocardioides yefusunii]
MTAPTPDPLMTRPPLPVVAVAAVLLAFALLTPADPVYRAGAAFAAILILLVVRDRTPAKASPTTATTAATGPGPEPSAPAQQPRQAPVAPTGNSRVVITSPGPTPADVAWVWRQYRSLDPAEERTPAQFAEQLEVAGADGSEVLAGAGLTPQAAEALAASLRKAGADVTVRRQAP